jgi:murein DD-endopeptidase / murein LD-carboxypeptidase
VQEIAKGFVGTPFVPQGRLPGIGLDCLGVVVCSGRGAAHLADEVDVSAWSTPDPDAADAQLGRWLRRRAVGEPIEPGDVLLFAVRGLAHLAVAVEGGQMVHASLLVMRVVCCPLDPRWTRRLHAVYCWEEPVG